MPPVEQFRGVSLGGWLVFESFLTVRVDLVISPYVSSDQQDLHVLT